MLSMVMDVSASGSFLWKNPASRSVTDPPRAKIHQRPLGLAPKNRSRTKFQKAQSPWSQAPYALFGDWQGAAETLVAAARTWACERGAMPHFPPSPASALVTWQSTCLGHEHMCCHQLAHGFACDHLGSGLSGITFKSENQHASQSDQLE